MKISKNVVLVGIAVIVILITGVLIYARNSGNSALAWLNNFGPGKSDQQIAQDALGYLNANLLSQGQTATLGNVSESSGLVKFQVSIGGKSYDSYVTKDGKLLFPQAYDISGSAAAAGNTSGSGTAQAVDASKVKTQGEPFIGQASAPATMALWTDYQCPFCKQVEAQVVPQLVTNYVDKGKLKIYFKDYQFLGADSQTLGKWGRAVWEADPAKWYDWHKAIFDNQGTENTGWASATEIMKITTQTLGAGEAAKVKNLVATKGSDYQKAMDADKTEGSSFGISGTPGAVIGTKLITGADTYSSFSSAVDAALAAK